MRARTVRPEEWARLRALRLRALAADPRAFGRTLAEEEAMPPEEWRAKWLSPRGACFVVERVDGGWVGMCGVLRKEDVGPVEVLGMWVAPEARGAGAGLALLDAARAWARERAAATIELWVNVDQLPAVRLYERAGFRNAGEPWRGTRDPSRIFQRMERAP